MTKEKKKDTQESHEKESVSKVKVKEDRLEPSSSESKESEDIDIKLLEEKEHFELEYFSKDDLTGKIKNLEAELTKLEENYKKAQKENSSWNRRFMHLQAEFENAQKRWDKNRQNLRIQYTASVLKSFLPLYDSFKKAVDSDSENSEINGFYNQFMGVLKSHGAEPLNVKVNDSFDYNVHEALTSIERDDIPKNSIIDIIQDGWKLKKNIIRYAKVIISKEPKPPEPEPEVVQEEVEKKEESVKEEKKAKKLKRKEKSTSDEVKPKEKKAAETGLDKEIGASVKDNSKT